MDLLEADDIAATGRQRRNDATKAFSAGEARREVPRNLGRRAACTGRFGKLLNIFALPVLSLDAPMKMLKVRHVKSKIPAAGSLGAMASTQDSGTRLRVVTGSTR